MSVVVECTEAQWVELLRTLPWDGVVRCARCAAHGWRPAGIARFFCQACENIICRWCALVDDKLHAKEHHVSPDTIVSLLTPLP